ncbi:MAG: ATP-grasp domain-containing protein [Chitinophagaceae bacterium]|nr:MAG: ATP-grasp domain-containing protein [Chitinophagaceae bacterium]
MLRQLLYRPFFIRLLNWEYWPFHFVYGPIYLYWVWLCIRARSIFFFNAANPSIVNGGFLMESKKSIYDLMPAASYPPTLFFKAGIHFAEVIKSVRNKNIKFPLIIKPDIGMQGRGVKKIETEDELAKYVTQLKVNFLIQAFVPFEKEIGIFYYRYPDETTGHISGMVAKDFLSVRGDGKSTIERLLLRDKRHILQLGVLQKTKELNLQEVLADQEKRELVPYGNHARGAKFIDASHLINAELLHTIDTICHCVPGFYYGRLDIRYRDWEELCAGKNFSVIELNGAGSEPTHMYDPGHSLLYAWKEIIRHWNILARISRMNHKLHCIPYMSFPEGLKMFRENKEYLKLLNSSQEQMD